MTVKELKKKLSDLPENMPIAIYEYCDGEKDIENLDDSYLKVETAGEYDSKRLRIYGSKVQKGDKILIIGQ